MSEHTEQEHEEHHGYGIYLVVWLALLSLTAITVTVASINLGGWATFAAIAIATVKASIVMLYFMHLREESLSLKIMVMVCLLAFVVFISLTFLDVLFR